MRLWLAPYSRELASPFLYGNRSISAREGICLRLETPSGTLFSEASPLPGHSNESLSDVMAAIRNLNAFSIGEQSDEPPSIKLPPSLRFAIEGFRTLQLPFGRPVQSNGLLPWNGIQDALVRLRSFSEKGYSTVKIKLTEANSKELAEFFQEPLSRNFRFRLDGNRSLSEKTLKSLYRVLEREGERVEYVEEPLDSWDYEILKRSPVPLAADESAADCGSWAGLLNAASPPAYFILKPMVSGGLTGLESGAALLRSKGIKVVYTSALEAEPGRRALISFLSRLPDAVSHGVSTGFLFRENFLEDHSTYNALPAPSSSEIRWLDSLSWEEVAR